MAYDDDATNNLLTDIAPILALFGEQFAKQFLSEGLSILDSIIFSLCPLGIITTMVGAIRVGGANWLRALIGRARENRAATELEFLSSTSHEVGEVWNGQAIVRTFGKPEVAQLIYFEDWQEFDEGGRKSFGIFTIETAVKMGYIKENDYRDPFFLSLPSIISARTATARDIEGAADDSVSVLSLESSSSNESGLNFPPQSPNISLNIHGGSKGFELWFIAISCALVQTALIVFIAFTVYHPWFSARYTKSGNVPVQGYAFPLFCAGTFMLAFGIFICASVIQWATEERQWDTVDGRKIRLIWIQRAHVVADQRFDSHVLLARDPQTTILTSRRVRDRGAKRDGHTGNDGPRPGTNALESLCLAGITLSLVGFCGQFQSLRALHWSASIGQLLAIIATTGFRAWLRRGMILTPIAAKVPDGFEVEWLASWFTRDSQKSSPSGAHEWKSFPSDQSAVDLAEQAPEEAAQGDSENRRISQPVPSSADNTLLFHQHVCKIIGWASPAMSCAMAAADAVQTIVTSLVPEPHPKDFSWKFTIDHGDYRIQEVTLKVDLSSKLDAESWQGIQSAILLRLFYTEMRRNPRVNNNTRNFRYLGPKIEALSGDLQRWIGPKLLVLSQFNSASIHYQAVLAGIPRTFSKPHDEHEQKSGQILVALQRASTANEQAIGQSILSSAVWALSTQKQLLLREKATFIVLDGSNPEPDEIIPLESVRLENSLLSEITSRITGTELALPSMEDAYSIIIPPLSVAKHLPMNVIVDHVRAHNKQLVSWGKWSAAVANSINLLRLMEPYGIRHSAYHRSAALVVDLLETVDEIIETTVYTTMGSMDENSSRAHLVLQRQALTDAFTGLPEPLFKRLLILLDDLRRRRPIHLAEERRGANIPLHDLRVAFPPPELHAFFNHHSSFAAGNTCLYKSAVTGQPASQNADQNADLKLHEVDIFGNRRLMYIYAELADADVCGKNYGMVTSAPDLSEVSGGVNHVNTLGWSIMHCLASGRETYREFDDGGGSNLLQILHHGGKVDLPGWFGMTPLHCAARAGNSRLCETLLRVGASLTLLDDRGRGALHWAALSGESGLVGLLLAAGASVHTPDKRGCTPLHLAAYKGRDMVIRALAEGYAESLKLFYARPDAYDEANAYLVPVGRGAAKSPVPAGKDRLEMHHYAADGWNPLHLACANGHDAAARALLNCDPANLGLTVHDTVRCFPHAGAGNCDQRFITPITLAISHGHARLLYHLYRVEAQARVAYVENMQKSHIAAGFLNDIAQELEEAEVKRVGCEVRAAIEHNQVRCLKIVLSQRRLEVEKLYGYATRGARTHLVTTLSLAVKSGNLETFKVFVDEDVLPDLNRNTAKLVNNYTEGGDTLLQVAIANFKFYKNESIFMETIKYLLSIGASPCEPNSRGENAIWTVVDSVRKNIIFANWHSEADRAHDEDILTRCLRLLLDSALQEKRRFDSKGPAWEVENSPWREAKGYWPAILPMLDEYHAKILELNPNSSAREW